MSVGEEPLQHQQCRASVLARLREGAVQGHAAIFRDAQHQLNTKSSARFCSRGPKGRGWSCRQRPAGNTLQGESSPSSSLPFLERALRLQTPCFWQKKRQTAENPGPVIGNAWQLEKQAAQPAWTTRKTGLWVHFEGCRSRAAAAAIPIPEPDAHGRAGGDAPAGTGITKPAPANGFLHIFAPIDFPKCSFLGARSITEP